MYYLHLVVSCHFGNIPNSIAINFVTQFNIVFSFIHSSIGCTIHYNVHIVCLYKCIQSTFITNIKFGNISVNIVEIRKTHSGLLHFVA